MKTRLTLAIALVVLTGCAPQGADNAEEEVRALIEQGEAAWNAGSVEGYMETYWKSPDLRFASGGKVTYGWQPTLDGYLERYPDRAAMGRLEFTDLEITVLADDAAPVSYTHLTLPTTSALCRSRWSPYH